MEAHKVAEGDPSFPPRGGLPAAERDPFPLPQRPLTLLSGQTELPTLPL